MEAMEYTVKRIMDDDYGCEERSDDWEPELIVMLVDDNGEEHFVRVKEKLLDQRIAEGSIVKLGEDGKTVLLQPR